MDDLQRELKEARQREEELFHLVMDNVGSKEWEQHIRNYNIVQLTIDGLEKRIENRMNNLPELGNSLPDKLSVVPKFRN